MTMRRSDTTQPSWPWFAGWLAVGAGFAFGLLGALSIGVLVLPVAALAAAGLARRGDPGRGLPGLVAGLGIAPLFVAYLNRDGPGTICTTTAQSVACEDQWSPWPWFAAGVVLLCAGIAWFVIGRRAPAPPPPEPRR
jgi:hypothetical protein